MSKYKKNEDILSIMSNLLPNCCLKIDFQKVGWAMYQIVTGVTSDVYVPSTYLVDFVSSTKFF